MKAGHVEIAGAGFAGLTLAAAMARKGWTVRVHERAPEARQFGAGIWFWENGLRVLNSIDAIDEALSGALMIPGWKSLDSHGKVIDELEFGDHNTGGRVFCMTRQRLYQAIMNAGLKANCSSKGVSAIPPTSWSARTASIRKCVIPLVF
jgi:2-methyl-3-hydroxypyridine 5-carboxylic acid dioxygenase